MAHPRPSLPLGGNPPRQDPVSTFYEPMRLCVDCGDPFVWVFSPADDRCEWCFEAEAWARGECAE